MGERLPPQPRARRLVAESEPPAADHPHPAGGLDPDKGAGADRRHRAVASAERAHDRRGLVAGHAETPEMQPRRDRIRPLRIDDPGKADMGGDRFGRDPRAKPCDEGGNAPDGALEIGNVRRPLDPVDPLARAQADQRAAAAAAAAIDREYVLDPCRHENTFIIPFGKWKAQTTRK